MDQQRAKEQACRLAAARGLALFSRGHQIFAVRSDGSTFLICGTKTHVCDIWEKAYMALSMEHDAMSNPMPGKYRLLTPYGLYGGSSMLKMLWNWISGKTCVVPS